jgi:nitrogenase-stabilizing/protective protein
MIAILKKTLTIGDKMTELTLSEEMEELSSAEDFLDFFNIDYEPKVVFVNRLHIMQRFHDYLEKSKASLPSEANKPALTEVYKQLLQRSYQDFVESDAVTEKVFKVFHMNEPQTTFVSADQLFES